jgi:hypothetical protein
VSAIRAGTEATSPLTQWLGGQHGEEEKSEEGSGEEDGKAPEEEVGSRHFKVLDSLMSMTASHGPAAVEPR